MKELTYEDWLQNTKHWNEIYFGGKQMDFGKAIEALKRGETVARSKGDIVWWKEIELLEEK